MRTACVTPTVMPRSLNEPVGLWPSCLSISCGTPVYSSIAVRCISGVLPSGWETMSCTGHDHLPEAPHARRGGSARRPATPLGELLQQLLAREVGRAVAHLEESAAQTAAGGGIVVHRLVAADDARLPAGGP